MAKSTEDGGDAVQADETKKRQDLSSPEAIRRIHETTYAKKQSSDADWKEWHQQHTAMLEETRSASTKKLASVDFQRRLWERNPVSSSGACSVSTQSVVEDRDLARWLAAKAKEPLPPRGPARTEALEGIYEELCTRVGQLTDRMPWLKILRVMATIFPEDFTNVVTKHMLRRVAQAMFGKLPKEDRDSPVRLNAMALDRLAEVLGPTDGSPKGLALRSEFVWCLWESISDDGVTGIEGPLVFPHVERRLKGIGIIPDPWNTVLDVVEFVAQDRPTRSATVDFVLGQFPSIKRVTGSRYLHAVWNTFGMLRLEGETFVLTAEGTRMLEMQDPDVLIRPFVVKVVGPDLVLWRLHHEGDMPRTELVGALQDHYRGWTTTFAPNTLLRFGRVFDMWESGADGKYTLTERGHRWAARIPTMPEPVVIPGPGADGEDDPKPPDDFSPPSLDKILQAFHQAPLVFPDEVVVQLHAALHASDSKHFVLLSGLSGTGKTQMAMTYANAYLGVPQGKLSPWSLLVSVQPDWTDPTGLLGYVNPLSGEPSYMGTKCLRFLLSAHQNSQMPHFLCLDEMNLARVEYYFAPFLSAMETGGQVSLHQEDENVDGVPPSLPWPANLFIFGTVNMDETTHAFSDKVLDRAFTIEFWNVDLDEYARKFAGNEANKQYPSELLGDVVGTLKEASKILITTHQHFGYRTVGEVLGFMGAVEGKLAREKALDQALFMKVLPKLRGQDSDAMRQVLHDLRQWAKGKGFDATSTKLDAMADELRSTGTTRFWR